jgi:hypothetical protein
MNNKNLIYLGLAALAIFLMNKKKSDATEDKKDDQIFPGGNTNQTTVPENN